MTVMYENHKLVYGLMCVAFYDVEDIKEYFNSFISFGRDRRATDPTVDSMVSEMERLSIGLDVQVGFFFLHFMPMFFYCYYCFSTPFSVVAISAACFIIRCCCCCCCFVFFCCCCCCFIFCSCCFYSCFIFRCCC